MTKYLLLIPSTKYRFSRWNECYIQTLVFPKVYWFAWGQTGSGTVLAIWSDDG